MLYYKYYVYTIVHAWHMRLSGNLHEDYMGQDLYVGLG